MLSNAESVKKKNELNLNINQTMINKHKNLLHSFLPSWWLLIIDIIDYCWLKFEIKPDDYTKYKFEV